MEIASDKRIVKLQGGLNFRDLGGYPASNGRRVRWNTVFRSGSTHLLNAADQSRLTAIGIRTVIDLRSTREREHRPHALRDTPNMRYWAHDHDRVGGDLARMMADSSIEAAQYHAAMMESYRELPYEYGDIYQHLFSSIAYGELPLVFNCAAGKDRTGVAAALLLCALGVAWNDVLADYMLTQQLVPVLIDALRVSETGDLVERLGPDVIATLFGTNPRYLEAMRESVLARSGSIDDYFASALRLDAEVLQLMRNRLLA